MYRGRLGPRGALDARLQSGVARAYGLTRLELEDLLSGVPHAGAAVRQRCFDELAREPAAI
jgi:hypothetical protein